MNTVAYLTCPREYERESGDAVVVRQEGERLIFAVIDALGHGSPAALVARRAVEVVESADRETSALDLQMKLHRALANTRGAAALVCTVSQGRIEGCGVGNVEMRAIGAPVPVVLSPGILGLQVRKFRVFQQPITLPTRLVAFTDGISPRFSTAALNDLSPEQACARLFAQHRRLHDDASVLVADLRQTPTA